MNEQNEPTWGIRFNAQSDSRRFREGERPRGCPDWFESRHISTWQEQGLIAWNNIEKKIECLRAGETLRLLDQLISQDTWKSDGVSITRMICDVNIELPHRGRRKKTEPEPKVEETPSKPDFREVLHLPPDAGYELINLIQANKDAIIPTAEFEKQRFNRALMQLWEWQLDALHQKEQGEFDVKTRNFRWQNTDKFRWTCQHQMATGKVCLSEDKWFWCVCTDRPGLPGKSNKLTKLQDAIEWVETEIIDLASQPEPEAQPSRPTWEQTLAEHVRIQEKLRNGPFWIEPALLETKKPTYRIFIELEAEPTTYKTYTSFCSGETLRLDKHYLSPAKLSAVLSLPFDHFGFRQILGENSGWHQITSLTAFYQETTVAEQAQNAWNHSQVLQQFKAGQIKRARYGYQEVETGYIVFLGICEKSEANWDTPESREEYFAREALKESVCFTLDIDDYRAFTGLSKKYLSDEELLKCMHTIRARSKHLPENIIRESRVWLAQQEPIR